MSNGNDVPHNEDPIVREYIARLKSELKQYEKELAGAQERANRESKQKSELEQRVEKLSSTLLTTNAELVRANRLLVEKTTENQVLHTQHITDDTTGIPNKNYLRARLTETIKTSQKYGTSFLFGLGDLDGFKIINDTFGHEEGDGILKAVTKIILPAIPEEGVFGRWYQGDEFAFILPIGAPKKTAELGGGAKNDEANKALYVFGDVLNRLEKANPIEYEIGAPEGDLAIGRTLPDDMPLTISLGVVQYDSKRHRSNWNAIAKQADALMYKSKEVGNKGLAKLCDREQPYSIGNPVAMSASDYLRNLPDALGKGFKACSKALKRRRKLH
ncbi:diguanylate cyclase [Candidatus Woesearchaeota archaeon]|nr:diguanylate cyclase [Candidatus Woesearchaeota archaeon]